MQLVVSTFPISKGLTRLMALRIDGRECLEGLVGFIVELMALEHVVGNNFVERDMLIFEQLFNKLIQSRVLLLKARKFQLCCLFGLSELFERARVLRDLLAIFLKVSVSFVEIYQSLVPNLFTIITDSELIRPSSDLGYGVLKLLNKVHVHCGHSAMHVHYPTRFIEVVMILTEDRSRCLLKVPIGVRQGLGSLQLFLHQHFEIAHVCGMIL